MGFFSRGTRAAGLAVACLAVHAAPAAAESDFGLRYWYGWGDTGKNLYDFDGKTLLSRLTYSGLKTSSAELYGRIGAGGIFLKGFAGIGLTGGGNLQDEDFLPLIDGGYSSTDSKQRNGKVNYATLDAGYYFAGGGNSRIGAFVGYNYFHQSVSAYGCTQTGPNPGICVPALDSSILGITQSNDWHSGRLGLSGDFKAGPLQLGGDAAVVWSSLAGNDSHWLRIGSNPGDFTGAIPEDGTGLGYQLEANADLAVTPALTIGVGARYWHLQTRGNAHFENHVVGGGGGPQPIDWHATMMGLTAHAAWRF